MAEVCLGPLQKLLDLVLIPNWDMLNAFFLPFFFGNEIQVNNSDRRIFSQISKPNTWQDRPIWYFQDQQQENTWTSFLSVIKPLHFYERKKKTIVCTAKTLQSIIVVSNLSQSVSGSVLRPCVVWWPRQCKLHIIVLAELRLQWNCGPGREGPPEAAQIRCNLMD